MALTKITFRKRAVDFPIDITRLNCLGEADFQTTSERSIVFSIYKEIAKSNGGGMIRSGGDLATERDVSNLGSFLYELDRILDSRGFYMVNADYFCSGDLHRLQGTLYARKNKLF
jgi:hypothetical protein